MIQWFEGVVRRTPEKQQNKKQQQQQQRVNTTASPAKRARTLVQNAATTNVTTEQQQPTTVSSPFTTKRTPKQKHTEAAAATISTTPPATAFVDTLFYATARLAFSPLYVECLVPLLTPKQRCDLYALFMQATHGNLASHTYHLDAALNATSASTAVAADNTRGAAAATRAAAVDIAQRGGESFFFQGGGKKDAGGSVFLANPTEAAKQPSAVWSAAAHARHAAWGALHGMPHNTAKEMFGQKVIAWAEGVDVLTPSLQQCLAEATTASVSVDSRVGGGAVCSIVVRGHHRHSGRCSAGGGGSASHTHDQQQQQQSSSPLSALLKLDAGGDPGALALIWLLRCVNIPYSVSLADWSPPSPAAAATSRVDHPSSAAAAMLPSSGVYFYGEPLSMFSRTTKQAKAAFPHIIAKDGSNKNEKLHKRQQLPPKQQQQHETETAALTTTTPTTNTTTAFDSQSHSIVLIEGAANALLHVAIHHAPHLPFWFGASNTVGSSDGYSSSSSSFFAANLARFTLPSPFASGRGGDTNTTATNMETKEPSSQQQQQQGAARAGGPVAVVTLLLLLEHRLRAPCLLLSNALVTQHRFLQSTRVHGARAAKAAFMFQADGFALSSAFRTVCELQIQSAIDAIVREYLLQPAPTAQQQQQQKSLLFSSSSLPSRIFSSSTAATTSTKNARLYLLGNHVTLADLLFVSCLHTLKQLRCETKNVQQRAKDENTDGFGATAETTAGWYEDDRGGKERRSSSTGSNSIGKLLAHKVVRDYVSRVQSAVPHFPNELMLPMDSTTPHSNSSSSKKHSFGAAKL